MAWPDAPRFTPPLLARLTAPAGPPRPRVVSRGGATVVAVPGRYCVTYLLVGPESVVIVDVGSVTDHPAILEALAWLARPVRAVVPTHLHMDHVIGVDSLARRLDVPVALGQVAHEAATGGRRLRFPRGLHTLRALPTYVMQGAPRPPLADWLTRFEYGFPWSRNRFRATLASPLEDGAALPGPSGWSVLHTPGHADDAICLYHAGAGFLVAGDTVRNFLGGEWNPLGCDPQAYARTKARLRPLPAETVFPGHGPILEGRGVLRRLRTLSRFTP